MANINFEDHTLRLEYSHRGGGIEISLYFIGDQYENDKMTAYQNYLGGGMLGSINSDCSVDGWKNNPKLVEISEKLKQYFHTLTNHEDDEWESANYQNTQKRPKSAY